MPCHLSWCAILENKLRRHAQLPSALSLPHCTHKLTAIGLTVLAFCRLGTGSDTAPGLD